MEFNILSEQLQKMRLRAAIVSEQVQKEARRAAVCFGLEKTEWDEASTSEEGANFYFHQSNFLICSFDENGELGVICLGPGHLSETDDWNDFCKIGLIDGVWEFMRGAHPDSRQKMARGLYCFGFEDEGVLAQLPQLTAHERLELRLSLPREFWPKTWLKGE